MRDERPDARGQRGRAGNREFLKANRAAPPYMTVIEIMEARHGS
jgi:hypothetical protein